MDTKCASDGTPSPKGTDLAQDCQVPARLGRAVEAEQQDALPLAEAERAVAKRNLLAVRAEQQAEEPLPLGLVLRHEAGEQVLEIGEEAAFPLLNPHQRDVVER